MKTAVSLLTPSTDPLSVAVLVFPQTNTLSFAAAVDPLRSANRQAGRTLFDWHYITPGDEPVALTSGISVPGTPLSKLLHTDLLMVVAGFGIEAHATPAISASLRRIARASATLAGIDGGPWILAQAGVLDGLTATTHWEDLGEFASRFPDVTTVTDRFCISGRTMTCAGAVPALDMMLHLIAARYGRRLAAQVAGAFIHDSATDPARPQTRAGPDPRHSRMTRDASAIMQQALDHPVPIPEIAGRLGISPRALEAQFQSRLGQSPKAHYLTLRLSEALRLVTQTDLPLIDVALATGFGSAASFARAFRKAHGTSARTLRSRLARNPCFFLAQNTYPRPGRDASVGHGMRPMRLIDLGQNLVRQADLDRPQRPVQLIQRGRPENRRGHEGPRATPGQRHMHRIQIMTPRDVQIGLNRIKDPIGLAPAQFRTQRHARSVRNRLILVLAGQQPRAQWRKGNQAHVLVYAHLGHIGVIEPAEQRIFVLHGVHPRQPAIF